MSVFLLYSSSIDYPQADHLLLVPAMLPWHMQRGNTTEDYGGSGTKHSDEPVVSAVVLS